MSTTFFPCITAVVGTNCDGNGVAGVTAPVSTLTLPTACGPTRPTRPLALSEPVTCWIEPRLAGRDTGTPVTAVAPRGLSTRPVRSAATAWVPASTTARRAPGRDTPLMTASFEPVTWSTAPTLGTAR